MTHSYNKQSQQNQQIQRKVDNEAVAGHGSWLVFCQDLPATTGRIQLNHFMDSRSKRSGKCCSRRGACHSVSWLRLVKCIRNVPREKKRNHSRQDAVNTIPVLATNCRQRLQLIYPFLL